MDSWPGGVLPWFDAAGWTVVYRADELVELYRELGQEVVVLPGAVPEQGQECDTCLGEIARPFKKHSTPRRFTQGGIRTEIRLAVLFRMTTLPS